MKGKKEGEEVDRYLKDLAFGQHKVSASVVYAEDSDQTTQRRKLKEKK